METTYLYNEPGLGYGYGDFRNELVEHWTTAHITSPVLDIEEGWCDEDVCDMSQFLEEPWALCA